MAEKKLTKDDSIVLLQEKYELLKLQGLDRYPQRSDFEDREVVAIKAFLGPWPRALETAGLKEKRPKVKKRPKRNAGKKTKETKNFERTEQHENK